MTLAEAWDAAVVLLGGRAGVGDHLDWAYSAPSRSYHDLVHVEQVVRDSDSLAVELGLSVRHRALVALAALAHDVVYDGRPGDDERASATWAVEALGAAGVEPEDAAEVARLVESTIRHEAEPADLLATALLDADLAVLGADPDSYDSYARKVRREYAAFDDATWALGRAAVLTDLLGHPHLYQSQIARDRWEAGARANLARELSSYR